MAGWKIQPTKRVDLPDDIADGLWISIHHPKLMPLESMQKLIAMDKSGSKDKGSADFDLEEARDLVTTMIVDWNLPGEDGQILPVPATDINVWSKIPPMPVITSVLKAMGEHVQSSEPDPNSSNGSANS